MREWAIYPAIDLRRGRVVRLKQGDPRRETRYADDPVQVAQEWQTADASWLHVVNLDGAFGEQGVENRRALECLVRVGIAVQFGGGLRSRDALQQALDLGVRRLVLGTAAVEDPDLVDWALQSFGADRLALGIDARDGKVRIRGWGEGTSISVLDLAQQWAERGVRHVVFSDVARDGMGSGLNVASTVELKTATGLQVIASGGVASLEDVRNAYRAGLNGVIIGRALYEGCVDLQDALRVGRSEDVG